VAKTRKKEQKPSSKQPEAVAPKPTDVATSTEQKPDSKKPDLNEAKVKHAISQGKALIKEGKSKADAARAIYAILKDEDKDVIVAAFVEGATLTEKGALTYWYNCKRKPAKEAKKSAD